MKAWPSKVADVTLRRVDDHALCAQPVEFFSPQGEVKGVRQASARFAQAMVPFGDPRELDPFDVDCAEKGKGRWADSRNWVYDFDRDLPAGVRCSFTLKSGIAALDGKPLDAGQRFAFTTGGPAVLRSLPYEGARIDENQIFVLGLDAPAKSESIAANVYCVAAGVNEKIGVRMVTGEERKIVLDNRKSFAASYLRFLFLDADEGRTRSITFRLPTTGSDDEKFLQAARRARFAAGDARLRAHAARRRRSEAGLGARRHVDLGRRVFGRPAARLPCPAGVSRVVLVRAHQQERALHSHPADDAFVHRAGLAARRGEDPAGRRRRKNLQAENRRSRTRATASRA